MKSMRFDTPEKEIAALAAALCIKVDAYVKSGNLLALQVVSNAATKLFHEIRKHYGLEEFGKMLDAFAELPDFFSQEERKKYAEQIDTVMKVVDGSVSANQNDEDRKGE